MNTPANSPLILLTGATGYIGGRLLQELESRNLRIRCLARRPDFLKQRVGPHTEVIQGDVLNHGDLGAAMADVQVAYYLVHSMGSKGSFEEQDRLAAENFGRAAKTAGVERIIYLGGLGRDDEELSAHLHSRHEVGNILRASGVPVLELRASIVIGSGSLSFEMIRSLVERLPVMITPKWVSCLAQPISIIDLLAYLIAAMEVPAEACRIYEVGGADQMSYGEIMKAYAAARNMRIHMLPVPVLTPYLSSLWLGLVTPLYARVGKKLIESVVHSTVVSDDSAKGVFGVEPMGVQEAIRRALANEDQAFAATRWSDAVSSSGSQPVRGQQRFGTRLVDSRQLAVKLPAPVLFGPIERIGGDTGYYAWNILWKIRGALDEWVGGIGLRRGRPHAEHLQVGDTVDFWRVEQVAPGERLRLQAEMKLPGRAWLTFELSEKEGVSTLCQTATFDPVGVWGRLYWFSLLPLHHLVFGGMLRGIVHQAERDMHKKREG